MKKFYASLVALVAVASTVLALNFGIDQSQALQVWDEPDCSTNAIIKCGVTSRSDLSKTVKNSKELQNLYGHFGISQSMIDSGTVKSGLVYKNGNVTVGNDKIVATDAWSVGRHYKEPDSQAFKVAGKTYYKRPTTNPHIFQNGLPQTAYIFFDKAGNYVGTIIKGCGNPIFSKPKEQPKPKPQPKPAAECVDLKVARIEDSNSYRLDATSSVKNGATVKSYNFVVRNTPSADPSKPNIDPIYFEKTVTTNALKASVTTPNLTALQPGKTYQASVSVKTSVGERSGKNCVAQFTVPEKEKEQPPKMIEVCDLETGETIEIKEEDFDKERHSTVVADCDDLKVCVIEEGKIDTIERHEFDDKLHTEDLSECDKEEVLGTETPKKGEAPKAIASTGPVAIAGGLFGSSALGLGVTSYWRSRRALSDLLR